MLVQIQHLIGNGPQERPRWYSGNASSGEKTGAFHCDELIRLPNPYSRDRVLPLKYRLPRVGWTPRIYADMRTLASRMPFLAQVTTLLCLLVAVQASQAQVTGAANEATDRGSSGTSAAATVGQNEGSKTTQTLRIGPSDEVDVTVFGAPDLSAHSRVDVDGNVFVPMVGPVHVIGMTSAEAGQAIAEKLQEKDIMNHPQVSVFLKEYTNSEISVGGEVNKPGVYSALGPHRLLDILQTAGGPTDKAGNTVIISHRGTNKPLTVELSKDPVTMATNNVDLQPGDTVIVSKAGIVYVLGEVYRPGGYISSSAGGVTVLQVMAAAGGPTRFAAAGKTRLLRRTTDGLKETSIPLPKLLAGKVGDIPVQPDDILYVPNSGVRTFLNSAIVTMGSQAAIYKLP